MDRIALLFPGQGAQFTGMGKEFYDEYETARLIFEEAGDVLGRDFKKICFEGNLISLNKMENMLPAIFISSVASFMVFRQLFEGVPIALAGHSLGEYSALVCSGAIRFADALRIVKKRCELAGRVMGQNSYAMTIVDGIDKFLLEDECLKASSDSAAVRISCYNSFEQFVVAGNSEAVMRLEKTLIKMKVQTTPMIGSAPFHSACMEEVVKEFKNELGLYEYTDPRWPVLANVSAQPHEGKHAVIKNLCRQLTQPVLWSEIMACLSRLHINIILDMGPQSIVKNLAQLNVKHIRAFSFDKTEDRKSFFHLTGINGQPGFYNFIEKCLGLAACIPNRNHDEQLYEHDVIIAYKKLERMAALLDDDKREANEGERKEALTLLTQILAGKKMSAGISGRYIQALLSESGTEEQYAELAQSLIS